MLQAAIRQVFMLFLCAALSIFLVWYSTQSELVSSSAVIALGGALWWGNALANFEFFIFFCKVHFTHLTMNWHYFSFFEVLWSEEWGEFSNFVLNGYEQLRTVTNSYERAISLIAIFGNSLTKSALIVVFSYLCATSEICCYRALLVIWLWCLCHGFTEK